MKPSATRQPDHFTSRGRALLLIALCALILIWSHPIAAQEDDTATLLPGQPVSGTLDADAMLEEWLFEGQANRPLSFHVRTLEGDLNPVLAIMDANGEVLAANDDAQFGDMDARLEGFIPSEDGLYTAQVYREGLAQGLTQGRYELLMLEGFGSIPVSQTSGDRLWLTVDETEQQAVLPPLPDGNFMLTVSATIRQTGTTPYHVAWTLREPVDQADVGLSLRFMWTSDGFWEMQAVDRDGEVQATTTGALDLLATPDILMQIAFTLRNPTFSVTINQEPVGDLALPENTRTSTSPQASLHFFVEDEPDAALSLIYDDITLTDIYYEENPAAVAIPPTDPEDRLFSYAGTPQEIIRELAERGIIRTDDGGIYAQIREGFVYTNDAGFSAYPLLGDNEYGDFVIGYTARLTEGPPDTACGLIFRQADGENFATALFTPNQDVYFLNYDEGQIGEDDIGLRAPYLERGLFAPHHFVLVAIGDQGRLYANGRLVGTIELSTDSGRLLAHLVLNDDEANAYCLLTDAWLWQFEERS